MESLNDYAAVWLATEDLSLTDLLEYQSQEVFFSLDLSEATYRMPYDIMDLNVQYMTAVMQQFKPWTVFRDLFSHHQRVVDCEHLIEKGYWSGAPAVISKQGSFMGDGLSFIHLTLLLGGLVRASSNLSKIPRPIGQSVGDDLFCLKTSFEFCMNFMRLATALNCEFSKINSISKDAATFCEQYMCLCTDTASFRPLKDFENSVFDDISYIDCVKGSVLSGKSKVKSDLSDPFIGHATMLAKQVAWNPLKRVRDRAPAILWAQNYMSAKGLGVKFASLPLNLGGLGIIVGNCYDYHSEPFKSELLPYYEAMLLLPDREFLSWSLLLRGILKANAKGIPYQNDWEKVRDIVKDCQLFKLEDIKRDVPVYFNNRSERETLSYINRTLGKISFHDLADLLARLDAFENHWNMKPTKAYMVLPIREARNRVNKAIAIMKSNLRPSETRQSTSLQSLDGLFRQRTWGLFVNRNDPAIIRAFSGMPLLDVDFDDLWE